MSIESANQPLPGLNPASMQLAETVEVPPHPLKPGEDHVFARQEKVPGHHQKALTQAKVLVIGAGGLGSPISLGLARTGIRHLTIVDNDRVDRANLPTQLYSQEDVGQPKALRLANNLASHLAAGGRVQGIALLYQEAIEQYDLAPDLLIAAVDNNRCRQLASQQARQRGIPVVFPMFSLDGTRCHCFLQGPKSSDPCLWCALPNLDPETFAPCAAATISTCFLAAAFTVFFVHRALMGWPQGVSPFNWRESDITGNCPDVHGLVKKRLDCPVCGGR